MHQITLEFGAEWESDLPDIISELEQILARFQSGA